MAFQSGRRIPQELKPAFSSAHGGTTEAVLFPKAGAPKPFRGL